MRIHDIDADVDPQEFFTWSRVQPFDLVRSPGTVAHRSLEFANRTIATPIIALRNRLLLIMTRHEGIPGEPGHDRERTFTVLSRHGVLVIVKSREDAK